ncbi:MAG: aspartate kinase, partial [Clostridia bacterium]|nr:aspartate kinase [Clostridia bacterium]
MRVCKFGGTALRDGKAFRAVREIVRSEPARQVIVASAPGKRDGRDEKVTDLLYACQDAACGGRAFSHLFDRVAGRCREIAAELGLPAPDDDLRQVYGGLREGCSPSWAASRGEWLSARLLGAYLGFPVIDAAQVIRFDSRGGLDEESSLSLLRQALRGPCVVPGFYGADGEGTVFTLSRGGSDVTAALAAAACNADVYENWKDVEGVRAADPALVADARCI